MNTFVLDISIHPRPKDVLDFINQARPQKGDKLTLVSGEKILQITALYAIAIIALVLAYYYRKKKDQENSEKLLQELFANYATPEEFERHIHEEYGIIVEIRENDLERNGWMNFSMENLNRAYSDSEPDYDLSMVKEPNPEYKP